ncbi:extracellular solute-binding protein family 5 [Candidatus Vecturithrix granuli]|uniref:Extracellular solute-binding protein family 5 n=1 Tax=Vecturithrix granuli TaxID=1499967 RepID=A0A081BZR2_VECG1|nr:extracellular solute-binding protein family 5 [Candidatus Vecturithrix granuli]
MKRSGLLLCILLALWSVSVAAEVKNPDTFIKVTYSTLTTLDPAACYDSIGGQRLGNINEKLIFFDGSTTDQFTPVLATEVPTLDNGGISPDGKTYTFVIRKGVKFHNGGDLTPEDVEYSFERNMITDPDGGPMWMMLEALTGEGSTRDADGKIKAGIFEKITNSVEVDDDKVILHLPKPYPPLLGILAGSWAVILDKEWAIEQGCWDGTLENAANYNNPPTGQEPLQKVINGTGPYKLKSWDQASDEFVFERFEEYWGPKPKLQYAIIKHVSEWSTRKLMFLNGDADFVSVDDPYVQEMANEPGIKRYMVPLLSATAVQFCQKINPTGNPYIGSGQLDGEGVPPDFFADPDVRKGFMHAFDRDTFQQDVLQNISDIPSSPNIPGLAYSIDVPVYEFDLEKAKEYFMKARNGEIWEKGFKLTITYNAGNSRRDSAGLILAENVMSLNPKFKVEVLGVELRDFIVKMQDLQLPLYICGWTVDYPDPHNMMYTFMHSNGFYTKCMAYANPEVDALVDEGIVTVDPVKRAEIYEQLQHLWYSEAIGFMAYQSTEVRHYRDWVQGFVPNPMDIDVSEWLWRLWKEEPK